MITVDGSIYKDVNTQDFSHYFTSTAMAYKISPTKRRLFLVSGVSTTGGVTGQYLTREKEFKDKSVPWQSWWTHLEPIVSSVLMFNTENGCGLWFHRMPKNLKKSFVWNTGTISFYGNIPVAERTMQNIGFCAFSPLYGAAKSLPSLYETLLEGKSAVTKERFIVDNHQGRLLFHTATIGRIERGKVILPKSKDFFKEFLMTKGLSSNDVAIEEDAATQSNVVIPQALNPHWVAGYDKNAYRPGYCVYYQIPGGVETRTYKGKFPGHGQLLPGWSVYNYWDANGVSLQ